MIITSEALGLYGQASGLGEPEQSDSVLSVPPLLMPCVKLYRPCTALHAGFLANGMATTSFFYSDRFQQNNLPAADIVTVVLGKGIWEINLSIATFKNYVNADMLQFQGIQISYDEGLTFASLWRTHSTSSNVSEQGILPPFQVVSTGAVGTRVAFFAHINLSGVGQTTLVAIQMQGLRLI